MQMRDRVALGDWGRGEVTDAAGTRMYAAVLGDTDAVEVVCVHGLGCSHRYFRPVAQALAPDARVVAPNLPGFGRTDGPRRALDIRGLSLALADWLRATDRGGSLLLANSMGCQIVVDLAVHSPQLLGPLVLAGPTMDRNARSARQQAARLVVDQFREPLSLWPVLARDYVVCGPLRFAQTFRYALADPIETKLHHVQVPAVVVRGERDSIVPHEWAQEVADRLPRGRLVEVRGAPHALNWSAPRELADVVRPVLVDMRTR